MRPGRRDDELPFGAGGVPHLVDDRADDMVDEVGVIGGAHLHRELAVDE